MGNVLGREGEKEEGQKEPESAETRTSQGRKDVKDGQGGLLVASVGKDKNEGGTVDEEKAPRGADSAAQNEEIKHVGTAVSNPTEAVADFSSFGQSLRKPMPGYDSSLDSRDASTLHRRYSEYDGGFFEVDGLESGDNYVRDGTDDELDDVNTGINLDGSLASALTGAQAQAIMRDKAIPFVEDRIFTEGSKGHFWVKFRRPLRSTKRGGVVCILDDGMWVQPSGFRHSVTMDLLGICQRTDRLLDDPSVRRRVWRNMNVPKSEKDTMFEGVIEYFNGEIARYHVHGNTQRVASRYPDIQARNFTTTDPSVLSMAGDRAYRQQQPAAVVYANLPMRDVRQVYNSSRSARKRRAADVDEFDLDSLDRITNPRKPVLTAVQTTLNPPQPHHASLTFLQQPTFPSQHIQPHPSSLWTTAPPPHLAEQTPAEQTWRFPSDDDTSMQHAQFEVELRPQRPPFQPPSPLPTPSLLSSSLLPPLPLPLPPPSGPLPPLPPPPPLPALLPPPPVMAHFQHEQNLHRHPGQQHQQPGQQHQQPGQQHQQPGQQHQQPGQQHQQPGQQHRQPGHRRQLVQPFHPLHEQQRHASTAPPPKPGDSVSKGTKTSAPPGHSVGAELKTVEELMRTGALGTFVAREEKRLGVTVFCTQQMLSQAIDVQPEDCEPVGIDTTFKMGSLDSLFNFRRGLWFRQFRSSGGHDGVRWCPPV